MKPKTKYSEKSITYLFINPAIININAQETRRESIEYYYSYPDYINNRPQKADILLKTETNNSITYDKIVLPGTNDKIKKNYNFWALKYKGHLYHNLIAINYEIAQDHAYGKFFIEGKKYNVIILDTEIDKKAIGKNGNPYGGGIVASALYKTYNSTWKDKAGRKYKILFYDAENPFMSPVQKENPLVRLVDTNVLIQLYNQDPALIAKLKANEYYLEDFLEFVNEKNK